MTQFCKTRQESREPSSLLKRIQTLSLFLEEKSRSAGNSWRLPKTRRRRPERLFKALRTRLPNFTRLWSKALVFLLVRTTLFTSL